MSIGGLDLWTYGPASNWFAHTETTTVMHRDEPNVPIEATLNADGGIPLDRQRLRATLRLCFAPEQADALTGRTVRDAADARSALAPLVRAARLSYGSARVLSLLGRLRRPADRALPLRPRLNLSSVPALALALHLGLALQIETLAALFGCSSSAIAAELLHARRAVESTLPFPCSGFVAAVGRYRDPVTDRIDDLLAFRQHLATCRRCQLALSEARQIDSQLLTAITENERDLSPLPEQRHSRRSLWLGPALLSGGVALLAVVLVLAGIVGWRRLNAGNAPVSLLVVRAPSPMLNGWLLQAADSGAVHAVNIASGEQRLLVPGSNGVAAQTVLAPDQRHFAQLITTIGENADVKLRAYALDGRPRHEWTGLGQASQNRLLGWLNDRAILVVRAQDASSGQLEQSTLIAFDIDTGTQRTILDGSINGAVASPDGRYLATNQYSGTGSVLEIRPVAGSSLGAPVATYAQGGMPLAWTRDGQLIFWTTTGANSAIDTITLDGKVTHLSQSALYYAPNMLGVSPDRTQLMYVTNTGSAGVHPWTYWELNLSDGKPRELVEGNAGYALPGAVVWSPTSNFVALTLDEPFYLPNPAQTSSATSTASYRTVAFDADGQSRGSLFDQFSGQTLLAWLPDDALPIQETAETGNDGAFQTAGLVASGAQTPQLTRDSRLSPDGNTALVYDQGINFTMGLALDGSGLGGTTGVPSDPSWLPDGSGSIGVQQHTLANGSSSRITLDAPGAQLVDFDPAQLGDSTTSSYRYPLLAPDGLHYSFFVIDQQTIALWIGGDNSPPHVVTSWQTPNGAKVDPPLIADWVDNDTLIYSEPESWRGGLPQRVTLHRLVLNTGAPTDDALISWQPHGNERGIVLQELRVSADQGALAIRLRHITGNDPSTDAFDTIEAASTSDLRQSFELARGTPGDGLSWSPDDTQLVAIIQKKLTIFTIHGGQSETVDTGSRVVSYPLWVLPNEIWYQSGSGNSSQMLRATR